MSNKFKYAALGAVFALIVGAVPALAQDEASPAPTEPPPEFAAPPPAPASDLAYEGELSFWNTMRLFEWYAVEELVKAWEEAHPGIEVKHELVPFDFGGVRTTKYLPAAENGTAPDIFRSDIAWTQGFADLGILADLTEFISDEDLADHRAQPLGSTTYEGRYYAIPHVTDALGLMCNKELLAEAGFDAPPATWDELVEAGTAIADLAAQKYGFYMRGDSYWALPFVWSWGGDLVTLDEEGKTDQILVNSPESVAGLNYLKDNILGTIAPASWTFNTDYTDMTEGFKAGTIMCILQGPWQQEDILAGDAFKDNPENYVVAPVPTGSDDHTGSPVGGHNFVVYTPVADDPDKLAAAADLINYLTSTEGQGYLATQIGVLPTRSSAYELPDVAADELISSWGEVMAKATDRAGYVAAPDIFDAFNRELQSFLIGDVDDQTAMDNVAASWQQLVTWDQ